ncbi:MAG: DUF1493 family protein [Bacteroidota bacterium]|nr:DUF1493 family protein [Bacteroidota bacterium]
MENLEKLVAFLARETKYKGKITSSTLLQKDLGIYGDDASELIVKYGKVFNVDVSEFNIAEHFRAEGIDFLGFVLSIFKGKTKIFKDLKVSTLEKALVTRRLI